MKLLARAAVPFLCACGSYEYHYRPDQDAAAVARMEKVWSAEMATNSVVLRLCENVAAAEAAQARLGPGINCQIEHVVRGRGLGKDEIIERDGGIGMGGCPFQAVAFMTATLTGPGLGAPVGIELEVRIKSPDKDNHYDLPYQIPFGVAPSASLALGGATIKKDGNLEVASLSYQGTSGPTSLANRTLTLVGGAPCPP